MTDITSFFNGKSASMILPRETVGRKFAFMFDLIAAGDAPGQSDPVDLVVVVGVR